VVILRTFLALAAGFATMLLLVATITGLLAKVTPEWIGEPGKPRTGYAIVSVGYSFLAAAAGGYVTAWAAATNPLIQVLALAIIVLAMAALSAMQERGKLPVWYALTLVAISPIGVLAGGLLRLRVLGIL